MKPKAATLRDRCLAVIKERGPLTADEVAEALAESILAIRPRMSELANDTMGRRPAIVPSGIRRKNASGINAVAWAWNA